MCELRPTDDMGTELAVPDYNVRSVSSILPVWLLQSGLSLDVEDVPIDDGPSEVGDSHLDSDVDGPCLHPPVHANAGDEDDPDGRFLSDAPQSAAPRDMQSDCGTWPHTMQAFEYDLSSPTSHHLLPRCFLVDNIKICLNLATIAMSIMIPAH